VQQDRFQHDGGGAGHDDVRTGDQGVCGVLENAIVLESTCCCGGVYVLGTAMRVVELNGDEHVGPKRSDSLQDHIEPPSDVLPLLGAQEHDGGLGREIQPGPQGTLQLLPFCWTGVQRMDEVVVAYSSYRDHVVSAEAAPFFKLLHGVLTECSENVGHRTEGDVVRHLPAVYVA